MKPIAAINFDERLSQYETQRLSGLRYKLHDAAGPLPCRAAEQNDLGSVAATVKSFIRTKSPLLGKSI